MPDRLLRDGRWMVVAHMEHPSGSGRQACTTEPLEEIPDVYAGWTRAVCPECRIVVAEAGRFPSIVGPS